jgi:uncharacterized protein
MRVIITGGTGLIGGTLAADLAKDNHEVIVLTRNPEKRVPLPGSVRLERWDARTADGWGALADGADAIVNLAGENLAGEGFLPSRWTDERKRLFRDSRMNAGQAVVEAVKAVTNKPHVVIQASSVGYYGVHGDEVLTEDSPPGNDFQAQLCKEWETSTAPVEAMGVRRAIIRTGVVLSATDGALYRLAFPFKMFVGGPLGSGKQYLSWIHLPDEASAIRFLIDNASASGPFNLSAPNPKTNAEFGRILGKVLARPSLIPVPSFAFRLAFGEVATVVVEGQRAIPKRLQELGFQFKFPDLEAALRDIYQKQKV